MRSTDLLDGINDRDVIGGRANAGGQILVTRPRHFWPWLSRDRRPRDGSGLSAALLAGAAVLLALLAVTQGYVSWHQQFIFDLTAKPGQHTASALEAIGLDSAAVIFAILGIALARLGRPARIERVLVAACALGSMLMNLLGADLASPRSVAVYVMPPVLFAAGADRLIAVIRRSALGPVADDDSQRSAWRSAGVAALYLLRFALAPPSTAVGMRRWLIQATPLPAAIAAPGEEPRAIAPPEDRQAARPRQAGGSKQARLIELAAERHDLTALPLASVSGIATDLAPKAGIHPGTARRVLLGHVRALQEGSAA